MYGHPPIRDEEGDVAIRVGSTMLFLRTAADGQEVVIFSAVVHDVSGRSRAAEVLNDLNVEARWVKFQLIRDRVFVTYSVLARPFVAAHLHQAVRIVSDVADGIDDELAAKLQRPDDVQRPRRVPLSPTRRHSKKADRPDHGEESGQQVAGVRGVDRRDSGQHRHPHAGLLGEQRGGGDHPDHQGGHDADAGDEQVVVDLAGRVPVAFW